MMRALLIAPIRAYRYLLSPWLGSACRFTPTCSAYAIESIDTWGAGRGSWLALRRISRCHPWCQGGHDPVPLRFPRPAPDGVPVTRSHSE
ncbi:MAG: membrane protein insertion efficiency factor YidD [Burkholderiaceae bacterium]|nr:membrane protein insertion efficiency factor YidD [Burkholderiaceae bacterium]